VGYLAFGPATQDIITFNLPQNWTAAAVKLSLCVGLFFTFSPMMIPVYQIIERGLAGKVRSFSVQPQTFATPVHACRRSASAVRPVLPDTQPKIADWAVGFMPQMQSATQYCLPTKDVDYWLRPTRRCGAQGSQ